MEHFPQADAAPPQLMPADALVKLDTVTDELLELAKASRANKVCMNTLTSVHQRPTAIWMDPFIAIATAPTCHA